MKTPEKKTPSLKRAAITNLILLVGILVLANVLGSFAFTRFDFTSNKRFTLHPASIELVENLEDYIYVKVYLEGELPADYRRLRNATQEMLDELRAYSDYIEYEFINPSAASDEKERVAMYQQLSKEGLTYTTPVEEKEAGLSQKLIWPGALITYRNKTVPLQLLKSQTYANENQMIERAINDLEYEFTNIFRKLKAGRKPRIAFLQGHGELDSLASMDIRKTLEEYYSVSEVRLDSNLTSLVYRGERDSAVKFVPRYDAVIVAAPDSLFSEKDKFLLDQYLMRGGKLLWFIDRVDARMDSLSNYSSTMVYPKELNLDDQLFRYGARINSNLLMDLRSSVIPVIVGMVGNQPKYAPRRWPYFPLSLPAGEHPIVKNLSAIRFDFAGSVDTVEAPGVRKTILLTSSKKSQLINSPARISLNILKEKPKPEYYNLSGVPLAVLLEGNFTSNFNNRIPPAIRDDKKIGFLGKSEKPGAVLVVGDGDVIRNHVNRVTGRLYPMGYDRFSGEMFGNRDFVLNCVNYLCDDQGLISVRSRNVQLGLLDESLVKNNKGSIQLKNVSLPVVFVILAGLFMMFWRKRKFARQPNSPIRK